MENNKNKKYIFAVIIVLVVILITILSIPYTRSMVVVKVYKEINKSLSPLDEQIHLFIPSGAMTNEKDWLPQMIWYHDQGGFSQYMNKNLDLTILYTYGDFNSYFGTSAYYDDTSPYYGAFYGGYIVQSLDNEGLTFGFDHEGDIIQKEIQSVPLYDQKYLVLPALGCPRERREFEVKKTKVIKNVTYANSADWIRIDSQIKTNGSAHKMEQFHIGYLQYGMPLAPSQKKAEDFTPQEFYGRMYVKYFEKHQMTICLYIMCRDKKIIDTCDKKLLSKTTIQTIN